MDASTVRVWEKYGHSAPYWSVLHDPRFTPDSLTENPDNINIFFQTGVDMVREIDDKLKRLGEGFNGTIVDFGCGTGRLVKGLQSLSTVTDIHGLDISNSHLEEAKKNCPDAYFYQITNSELPDGLPEEYDGVISLIVLQHNKPWVMKHWIKKLLGGLRPGGVAVLQIPHELPASRIAQNDKHGSIQMWALEKDCVRDICNNTNCSVIMEEDGKMVSPGEADTIYYIRRNS